MLLSAGTHEIRWDSRDTSDSELPEIPGVYLYRLAKYGSGDLHSSPLTGQLVIIR